MDSKQIREIYGPDVEIRKLSNVKVLTPDGLKPVSMIKRSKAQGYYKVSLEGAGELKASGSHKVLCEDGHFYYINMLQKGMYLQGHIEVLEDPEWIEGSVYLYDLLDVEGNVYVTVGGVINHNCAFIDNIEETFAAAQQTLATGGQAMLLSTPNGMGNNFFYKTWVKAELGENSFVPVKLPWQVHPERDQAWRDKQDADLGPRFAGQECVKGNTLVCVQDKVGNEYVVSIEDLYKNTVQGKLSEFKILAPGGFKSFYGVRKVHKDSYCRVYFQDGTVIEASDNHRIYLQDQEQPKEIFKLEPGDRVCTTDSRVPAIVSHIDSILEEVDLYDALEVADGHKYYTGNLLSSNCDCNFLTSGDTIFEFSDLEFYETTYMQDPVERRGIDSNFWIWERPDYSRSYLLSADVARGDGTDYSAFHIWDVETCTQVAEYKGKMTPKDYGAFLVAAATEYNNALLVCENANIGWATIEEILSRGYQNLYYSMSGVNETADSYAAKMDKGRLVPGFTTSARTRPLVVAKIYDYIHERSCVVRSKRLLTEMRNFIWKNGKAQAQEGMNDDVVMSAAIGLYVRDTALQLRQQGLDLSRAQLNTFGSINQKKPVIYQQASFQNPYEIKDNFGHNQDISWVLK